MRRQCRLAVDRPCAFEVEAVVCTWQGFVPSRLRRGIGRYREPWRRLRPCWARVEGSLPASLMLEPGVPAGGMMKAAVLTIGFAEKAILPVADFCLGKVAELLRISATFRVLTRSFVRCHDLATSLLAL
jgi:hypothetical protein